MTVAGSASDPVAHGPQGPGAKGTGADAAGDAPAAPKVKPTPRQAADIAFDLLLEKKTRNVLLLDIEKCSDLADYMIVATTGSARQTSAIALEVDRHLRSLGLRRLNMSGIELGAWAILDFGDLFIHVMQERERRYYDLEALWADGEELRRETGTAPAEPPTSDGEE